ncbi:hypothetical protein SacmaDRAFT_4797 [Saccharomonospora marina XMU15]|uniref:SGNH hydrolase-type esterase domain-containing protein n=1 Tax=Saccharomonospora marina XMU15 TaxID=882083 RepID=H5WZ37_9PSEU|nr:SGNH/GDSL hydrolase family protein [Saccharomonospora marina]EHR52971.1 hypothetical protein SacmaDRAFT_4797 [Saccharomonospora marina XMU15]
MRRALATLATATALLTTGWLGALAPAAQSAPTADGRGYYDYVSLGDSFTSGTGIPNQVDLPCTRSDRNYPSLVASRLEPSEFTDVSCGGADTTHMTSPQWGVANAAQFDALATDTDLVTIGIGGNDIPFVEVIVTCATLGAGVPHGSPCRDYYNFGGTDRLAEKIRAVGPLVADVLRGIAERSPRADIYLVGYPVLLPDSGANCWPVVPISDGDAPYLRDMTKLLNQVLAQQAQQHGVTFVDTYTSSIGHDMCKPTGEKWVEAVLLTSPAAPVHPNALGARNQARQVLAALGETADA